MQEALLVRGRGRLSLSDKELLELEELCSQFEKEWNVGSGMVESYVSRASDRHRSFLIRELVPLECELRTRSGCDSHCAELRLRLPQWSSQIDEACSDCPLKNGEKSDAKPGHPERLGDYRILRQIGRGGAGIVYEAEQESLGRPVAIKVMTAYALLIPEAVERFQRESRTVAALQHPNIVQAYGTGEQDGLRYYAMQLIDGKSLDRVIRDLKEGHGSSSSLLVAPERDQPPITMAGQWRAIAKIGVQIADALSYAHSRGILHRDIKPANLLLEGDNIWVTDFGLAKLHQEGNATRTGDIVGTIRYLPPEAVEGTWDERGDVYGLGLTLYELLALRPTFDGRDRTGLLQRITHGDPPKSLRKVDPAIPRDVDTIIMKAIARDPLDRYQTASDLAHDLQSLQDGRTILARRAGALERLWKWSRRKPYLAALVAVVTLVAVIGFPVVASLWLRAEEAKQLAEVARDNSEAISYASSMQLAHSFIEKGNPNEVRALLHAWSDDQLGEESTEENARRFGWEWNYLNSQLDASIRTLTGAAGPGYSIAVRRDGLQLATAGTDAVKDVGSHQSQIIQLWNLETGQITRTLQCPANAVTSLAYSPDGKWLAAVGRDKRIVIWDSETGDLLQNLAAPAIDPDKVHSTQAVFSPIVSFSSNGSWICSSANPLVIRDTKTWEVAWQVKGTVGTFVPGVDQLVAHVGGAGTIYDLNSTRPLKSNRSMGAVSEMTFSDDGKRLCTRSRREGLRIWKFPSLELEHEIIVRDVYWSSLSPDGKVLVHADQSGVLQARHIDKTEPPSILIGHQGMLRHGAYHSASGKLFTCGDDATVREWNTNQVSWKKVIRTKVTNDSLGDLAFDPTGKRLLCVSRWDPSNDAGKLTTLDIEKGAIDTRLLSLTTRAKWPRTDFAFSRSGRWLAVPAVEDAHPGKNVIIGDAESRRVHVFCSETARLVKSLELPTSGVSSLAWSRDDAKIAVASLGEDTSSISVFEVEELIVGGEGDLMVENETAGTPKASRSIAAAKTPWLTWHVHGRISAIGFNATSRWLAASTETGTHIWDLQTEHRPTRMRTLAHDGAISGESASFLDWSLNNHLAASYQGADVVRVHDVTSGQLKYEIAAPRNPTCVRFSPNGERLAIVGYDSLVHLCDALHGHRVLTLKGSTSHAGKTSITARVLFSTDGDRIVTNDRQGRITVWEAGAER